MCYDLLSSWYYRWPYVSLFKSSFLLVIFHVFLSQVAQTFIDIPNIKTSYNITYLGFFLNRCTVCFLKCRKLQFWFLSSFMARCTRYAITGKEPMQKKKKILFVSWLLFSLRYLCLLTHSGVQHIMCSLFVFVLCTPCWQFLWSVHFLLPFRYSLTFIYIIPSSEFK
jgi:hypothetical protein